MFHILHSLFHKEREERTNSTLNVVHIFLSYSYKIQIISQTNVSNIKSSSVKPRMPSLLVSNEIFSLELGKQLTMCEYANAVEVLCRGSVVWKGKQQVTCLRLKLSEFVEILIAFTSLYIELFKLNLFVNEIILCMNVADAIVFVHNCRGVHEKLHHG